MALTRQETGITWSSAASVTLSTATLTWSDAVTFDATDIAGGMIVSADNAGTPASGDTVEVWAAYTTGDVLGDTGDDFATDEHAVYLGLLDTYGANTPGEDPARKAFALDVQSFKGFKLGVKAANAATRNVVVRARLQTQRSA